jgi:uncharacterized protein YbaR (Trm112 family)
MEVAAGIRCRPDLLASLEAERQRPVAPALRAMLCCPDCRGALAEDGPGLRCVSCSERFPGQYGVPILYPSAKAPRVGLEDALDRLCGADEGRRATLRRVHARLRRNERAPGAVRRALWSLERRLGW